MRIKGNTKCSDGIKQVFTAAGLPQFAMRVGLSGYQDGIDTTAETASAGQLATNAIHSPGRGPNFRYARSQRVSPRSPCPPLGEEATSTHLRLFRSRE